MPLRVFTLLVAAGNPYWASKRNAVMAQLLWATAYRYSEIAQMTRAQLVDLFNAEGVWIGYTCMDPSSLEGLKRPLYLHY
jgi:hypothetical protein